MPRPEKKHEAKKGIFKGRSLIRPWYEVKAKREKKLKEFDRIASGEYTPLAPKRMLLRRQARQIIEDSLRTEENLIQRTDPREAALALGELGGGEKEKQALRNLLQYERDDGGTVGQSAVRALSKFGDLATVEKVVLDLDMSTSARLEAMNQLGWHGKDRSLEPLVRHLTEKEYSKTKHWETALQNIGRIGGDKALNILRELKERRESAITAGGEKIETKFDPTAKEEVPENMYLRRVHLAMNEAKERTGDTNAVMQKRVDESLPPHLLKDVKLSPSDHLSLMLKKFPDARHNPEYSHKLDSKHVKKHVPQATG